MTQEKKSLLLKDLSARLPYGVKCIFHSNKGDIPATLTKIDMENEVASYKPDGLRNTYCDFIENIKPYLRPMYSMTEEEREEFQEYIFDSNEFGGIATLEASDWLNKNMFDYRGLIPKGLALEAPEGMYNN